MSSESDDLNVQIGYQVQATAEWRHRKAEEFPSDTRNLEAAKELERLGAEIEALEGSEIHHQISEATDGISRLNEDDAFLDIGETVSEELRSVGFHSGWMSGQEFLEWYRDLLREKLHDLIEEVAPPPNLEEQVENDPTVKAAKSAYDEARAKALAEARKRL